MDSMILAFSFASAIAVAACVLLFFSGSIDEALRRVLPSEMTQAWSRYVKFALFVVIFTGGMRLTELAQFLTMRAPSGPPLTAAQGLLEVFRSIAGSLIAASATLLVIFGATLAIDALKRVYQSRLAAAEQSRSAHQVLASEHRARERPTTERPSNGRQPVGSERHAGGKDAGDRKRIDESGRFL
jgi:hypothetical protein